jgi:hypothetical protein
LAASSALGSVAGEVAGVDELGAARFRPRPKGAAGRREGLAVGSTAAAAAVVVVIAAEVVLLAVLTSLDSLVLELKLTLTSYSSIPVKWAIITLVQYNTLAKSIV